MADLTRSLSVAIGRAALARHEEDCDQGCRNGEPCVVGRAHRKTLADLTTPRIPPVVRGGDQ